MFNKISLMVHTNVQNIVAYFTRGSTKNILIRIESLNRLISRCEHFKMLSKIFLNGALHLCTAIKNISMKNPLKIA